MEEENYIKLIFENGSVVIRKVKDYHAIYLTQHIEVEFENGNKQNIDMLSLTAFLGRLVKIKNRSLNKRTK